MVAGLNFDHRVDLQMEQLHPGDVIAVVAGTENLKLGRIQQGLHHPAFIVEVGPQ